MDSESGSALNMSEDECLEDNTVDTSFASSHLNPSPQQGEFSLPTNYASFAFDL